MRNNKKSTAQNKKIIAYVAGGLVILLLLVGSVFLIQLRDKMEDASNNTASEVPEIEETPVETPPATANKIAGPTEKEPVMIDWMADLYAENPDIVAWIEIEGTKLNYPVMFTPDDEEKYIYKDFEGNYDLAGLPFIDKDCSMDPESDNIIIYGHNMMNGKAFRTIFEYNSREFFEEHPTIKFTTLYEERTYEVVSVFYDKVYFKSDTCFMFYQFIDAETEEQFDEAVEYFIRNSTIDTGVVPEYGDNFIMLVTCSAHVEHGRYVLVAREVTEEPVETEVID